MPHQRESKKGYIYTNISLRTSGPWGLQSSSGLTWIPENLRKHCYLLLRSHLGTGKPSKTLLFAAPELLGRRKTCENTAICCSGATWAPEYLRKHCSLLLRGHLGAASPPKTLLYATPGTLGRQKTSENNTICYSGQLGRQKTSENTGICCSGITWAPEFLRKHCCVLFRSPLGSHNCATTKRSEVLLSNTVLGSLTLGSI